MSKIQPWKTISSTTLFHDQWFHVRRDRCETASGKIIDPYYVYEFATWVAALPITKDGKVVLIRQYRHAIGEIVTELPGGVVDATDLSLEAAIARELREETGCRFEQYDYLGKISPNPSTNTNFLHMFLARGGEMVAEQSLDENEEIEVLYVTIDELKTLLRNNQFLQSMHVSCVLYALEKLGELQY